MTDYLFPEVATIEAWTALIAEETEKTDAAMEGRRRALLRKATTEANARYGIGGRAKSKGAPTPVTIAKLNWPSDEKKGPA